ncbi:MAG: methyltransferase domain-containing protein [Candidatus Sulfotelmatobacter sp.]
MPAAILRRLLAHPLTASLSLDNPATTEMRNQIIASKPFLKCIYDEWYRTLAKDLPAGEERVLELGSGAGYLERFIPGLITSEIFHCSRAKVVADAQEIPFADGSLRAIVMTDVLHHMPHPERFFAEASRCLCRGGKILMIEPWVTPWSQWVYTRLHHEPFRPEAEDWSFSSTGPLSGSNSAIPWIVFVRDRRKFESLFPELAVERIRPFMPFRYLVSGGVGMRSLMPGFTHSAWAGLESMLESQMPRFAMFAFLSLQRS